MEFNKGQIYWVEHSMLGTYRATLEIVSENCKSLVFRLDLAVSFSMGGGMAVSDVLLLRQDGSRYVDIFNGEVWTIYEDEPRTKLPTK